MESCQGKVHTKLVQQKPSSSNARKILMFVQRQPGLRTEELRGMVELEQSAFYSALGEIAPSFVYRCKVGRSKHLFLYEPGMELWAKQAVLLADLDSMRVYEAIDRLGFPTIPALQASLDEQGDWSEYRIRWRVRCLQRGGLVGLHDSGDRSRRRSYRTYPAHPEAIELLHRMGGSDLDAYVRELRAGNSR